MLIVDTCLYVLSWHPCRCLRLGLHCSPQKKRRGRPVKLHKTSAEMAEEIASLPPKQARKSAKSIDVHGGGQKKASKARSSSSGSGSTAKSAPPSSSARPVAGETSKDDYSGGGAGVIRPSPLRRASSSSKTQGSQSSSSLSSSPWMTGHGSFMDLPSQCHGVTMEQEYQRMGTSASRKSYPSAATRTSVLDLSSLHSGKRPRPSHYDESASLSGMLSLRHGNHEYGAEALDPRRWEHHLNGVSSGSSAGAVSQHRNPLLVAASLPNASYNNSLEKQCARAMCLAFPYMKDLGKVNDTRAMSIV